MDLSVPTFATPSLSECTFSSCRLAISFFCNGFFWFLQFQSTCTFLGLAIAWLWASQCRVRESKRIRAAQAAGNSLPHVDEDMCCPSMTPLCLQQAQDSSAVVLGIDGPGREGPLPMVTVILAVKGFVGEVGMNNWRSQLVTMYAGEVEYIFSVESEEDPAYFAVQRLQKEMKGRYNVRLVVAGLAVSCSQQIHNQMAGAKAASPSSSYILFLDDDIQCHPGTIGALVKAMETRPEVFCATGYSFDLPSTPSVAAYAAMAYRLPLLVGMSSGGPTGFVWGGCIMLRAADVRVDRYGMVSKLKNHGYSNDLILSAVATSNHLPVWCPPECIFPGRMSGHWGFLRYWNYVRRQQYALFTYSSLHGLIRNFLSCFVYSYLAAAVIVTVLPSLLQVLLFLLSLARTYALSFPPLAAKVAVAANLAGSDTAAAAAATTGAAGATTVAQQLVLVAAAHSLCPVGLLMSCINLLAAVVTCLAAIRLFHAVITLCNLLSPEKRPFRVASLSLPLAIAGMAMNLTLLPLIALVTALQPAITWAGITYVRRNGLVASVTHPAPVSPKKQQQQQLLPEDAEEGEGRGLWEDLGGGKPGGGNGKEELGGAVGVALLPVAEAVAVNVDGADGTPEKPLLPLRGSPAERTPLLLLQEGDGAQGGEEGDLERARPAGSSAAASTVSLAAAAKPPTLLHEQLHSRYAAGAVAVGGSWLEYVRQSGESALEVGGDEEEDARGHSHGGGAQAALSSTAASAVGQLMELGSSWAQLSSKAGPGAWFGKGMKKG